MDTASSMDTEEAMRIVWIVMGVLVAVGVFLVYPSVFQTIVSWVVSAYHWAVDFISSQNATNVTNV
jgi:hypothetical protein